MRGIYSKICSLNRLHLANILPHVTLYCLTATFVTLCIGRGRVPVITFAVVIICTVVLRCNRNCLYDRADIVTRISETLLAPRRLCRGDYVSPRKLLSALPTVTRALIKFVTIEIVGGQSVRCLTVVNILTVIATIT